MNSPTSKPSYLTLSLLLASHVDGEWWSFIIIETPLCRPSIECCRYHITIVVIDIIHKMFLLYMCTIKNIHYLFLISRSLMNNTQWNISFCSNLHPKRNTETLNENKIWGWRQDQRYGSAIRHRLIKACPQQRERAELTSQAGKWLDNQAVSTLFSHLWRYLYSCPSVMSTRVYRPIEIISTAGEQVPCGLNHRGMLFHIFTIPSRLRLLPPDRTVRIYR